jgi:hypothetical protein
LEADRGAALRDRVGWATITRRREITERQILRKWPHHVACQPKRCSGLSRACQCTASPRRSPACRARATCSGTVGLLWCSAAPAESTPGHSRSASAGSG